jgi:hypothetical protein
MDAQGKIDIKESKKDARKAICIMKKIKTIIEKLPGFERRFNEDFSHVNAPLEHLWKRIYDVAEEERK